MKKHKKNLVITSLPIVIALTLSGLLIYSNVTAEQCPLSYTQQQVDESNCIIGANIGIGFSIFIISPILIALGTLASTQLWNKLKQPNKKSSK